MSGTLTPTLAESPSSALEVAKTALAQAETVQDARRIAEQGKLFQAFAKAAGLGREMQNNGVQIVILAQRSMGEMLAETELHNGDPRLQDGTRLSDLGITKAQSHRYQKLARVPSDALDKHISDVKSADKALTVAGVLRLVVDEPKEPETWNSLTHMDKVRKVLRASLEKWPADARDVFADQLIIIAQQIHSSGSIA